MLVNLCVQVSYNYHSHLIGRAGQYINLVMEKTNTRIHFPDQNRLDGYRKSNQVVIRGQLRDVEIARQKIRVYTFTCHIFYKKACNKLIMLQIYYNSGNCSSRVHC